MTGNLLVYDPVAPCYNKPQLSRGALDTLAGKTIGFIDNSKPNFQYLVDDLSPQHANVFHAAGWSKAEVKRRLWEASKIRAGRSRGSEFERMATGRHAELGEITSETMVPISKSPEDLSLIVAGGPGSHSVFVLVSAHTRSSTREIVLSE